MTTTATGDTRSSGPVDVDELFMKLSVPELNNYERRTRQDIESKKQELRMMVGERYRDLIGAADCIVRMKETAFSVQDNIGRMRNSCDIHALKRNVAAKTKKVQKGAMDDMKKSLYTSAAQIKLLADAPEQIWRNIENNNYLNASRLYLISKAIYDHLNAGISGNDDVDSQSVKVMETFPVVGRQWDAVSHFRTQILQKSKHYLKSAKETDMDVIETICAIMLLDNVNMRDMFQLLLNQRLAAIQEALEPKGSNIGDQIVEAISILKATLFHVGHIFLESEQHGKIPLLKRHLRSLQQTFSTPSNNALSTSSSTLSKGDNNSTSATQLQPSALPHVTASIIPRLYPTTPNIHLLVRYLPEPIQSYTPFIRLEGSGDSFTQQNVFQDVQRWVETVIVTFGNEFNKLLRQAKTSTELVAIRSKTWAALQADELALELTLKATSTTTATKLGKSTFNDLCSLLLSKPFSVWNLILQSGFVKALQDVIESAMEELSHQPDKLLRRRLGELDMKEDPNHDVGGFIWDDSPLTNKNAALLNATDPLIQKIRGYVAGRTDLVAETIHTFEERLRAIRADQEKAMICERILHEDMEEELERFGNLDLFHAKEDTQKLVEFYQERCVQCIKAYTTSLEQLVKEAVQKPEKARNTVVALDRAMTIGRGALGIASMGDTFQRALTPPRDNVLNSNFAQARAAKAKVDSQVQDLISGLQKVYLMSHEAWIEHVEWKLNKGIKHYLKESSWTDLATLAWEPIPSATNSAPSSRGSQTGSIATTSAAAGTNQTADDAKTLLPFHGSTRLVTALHQVCLEMHRVGTCHMKPELIQMVTVRLAFAILQAVDQFLDEASSQDLEKATVALSEKGALQLLFDVKFLNLVFQSSATKDTDLSRLFKSVLDRIRGHIDPINLAVFEKPLDTNADRQYSRVAVVLGLLVQLNPSENRRKVNVVEKSPHVFAMAPLTARFTLLPIGQKMTGRIG